MHYHFKIKFYVHYQFQTCCSSFSIWDKNTGILDGKDKTNVTVITEKTVEKNREKVCAYKELQQQKYLKWTPCSSVAWYAADGG